MFRPYSSVAGHRGSAALRLGLPENLANVIRSFYQGQCRFVSWQAQFGRQPIVPQTSLMQGCRFSCTLLNSVMRLWCCSLAAVPDISRSVYLDDRAIWCVARDPVPSLLAAFQVGERVDRVFDLQLRPGKLQSLSSCPEVRAALEPRAQSVGVPVSHTLMPGLPLLSALFGAASLRGGAPLFLLGLSWVGRSSIRPSPWILPLSALNGSVRLRGLLPDCAVVPSRNRNLPLALIKFVPSGGGLFLRTAHGAPTGALSVLHGHPPHACVGLLSEPG